MRHFLPSAPAQQLLRVTLRLRRLSSPRSLHLPFSAPQSAKTQQTQGRSRSARRHPFPKRQGPRPKIALDPAPPASSWSAGQEEERVESRHGRTAHQKASLKGIVHFEIKIWYVSAYPKGIQYVGVFFSSVDPILMFLGETVVVCQSYNGRYRSLSLWEGKRTCTEKFKLNNSPS